MSLKSLLVSSCALLFAAAACTTNPTPAGDGGGGQGGAATGGSDGGNASSSGGASTGGSNPGGGGAAPADKVPMFIAQGHMGMTAVSCDDGRTWTGYRTFETEASPLLCGESAEVACFSGACTYLDGNGDCQTTATNCDCDHNPGSGKGLAFGDGAFVATFGWGQPGVVLRSTNGLDWTEVDAGHTYADVVAGNGFIALSARSPMFSTDGGLTYVEGTDAAHDPYNVRRLFYFPSANLFMQTAASGDNRDLRLTADWMNWSAPTTLPAGCESVREAVEGNNVIVTAASEGYVCRSLDAGQMFERIELPNGPTLFSGPVWDGAQFLAWGTGAGNNTYAYASADGSAWTETQTNLTGNLRFTEVARDPITGTMVAARSQWQNWYAEQRWYRSSDGVTWDELAPADGILSHPVRELTFGFADPSGVCPLSN